MLDSASVLTVGQIVPDYELLRRIGTGAYGEVWLARSRATGVLRAAKIVWRRTFDDDRPFQREFEGVQRFEQISRGHPSQLSLFHIGRDEAKACFYYVMELADNVENHADAEFYSPRTLRADLKHGRLPAGRILEIGVALAEALNNLHRNGLVHRDVKPSNVIFVNGRPKLADIGLVTDASDSQSIVGTEGYLPPEGSGTPQADIFALGKVLYEAATGLDRQKFPQLPPDLRSWPDAKEVFEINEVLLKACAADPRQRYPNAETMLSELALLQGGKSVKRKRTQQRYLALSQKLGLGLAALAALAGVFAVLTRGNAPSDPYPDGQPSTNAEATRLCAKGLLIIREDDYAQGSEACTNFLKAIELDPHFARPYVGLLEIDLREPIDTPLTISNIAAKLEELAPHLSATYCAQSIVAYFNLDFPQAEERASRAAAASAGYELGHTWYGYILNHFGRPVEGRAQLEISRTIAPAKAIVYRCMGHTYYMQRDFTNAIAWYRKAIDLDRHHGADFHWLGHALWAMGDYTGAFNNWETGDLVAQENAVEVRQRYQLMRQAFQAGGARKALEEEWKLTAAKPDQGFYSKACLKMELGDTNAALNLLAESFNVRERDGDECKVSYLLFDTCWDGLHDDQRFKELLDKVGFTKVMPARMK